MIPFNYLTKDVSRSNGECKWEPVLIGLVNQKRQHIVHTRNPQIAETITLSGYHDPIKRSLAKAKDKDETKPLASELNEAAIGLKAGNRT